MSGASYTVGQELWFESAVRYRTSGPVQVEKIGRKWVTLVGQHNGRFDIATGRLDSGGSGSSSGQIWPTREACDAEKARQKAWERLAVRMRVHWRPRDGLTVEQICQVEQILFALHPRDGAPGCRGGAVKALRYRPPNRWERDFLWQLRPGELVTRGDVGCVVMGAEARARQSCRRRGWATHEGRGTGWMHDGWVLTDAGARARAIGASA